MLQMERLEMIIMLQWKKHMMLRILRLLLDMVPDTVW
jgi:hypothetical protein